MFCWCIGWTIFKWNLENLVLHILWVIEGIHRQWGNCVHNRRFCTAKGFHWHKRHIQISKTFLTAQLEDKMVLVRDGTSKLNLAKKLFNASRFWTGAAGRDMPQKTVNLTSVKSGPIKIFICNYD